MKRGMKIFGIWDTQNVHNPLRIDYVIEEQKKHDKNREKKREIERQTRSFVANMEDSIVLSKDNILSDSYLKGNVSSTCDTHNKRAEVLCTT